MRIWIQTDFCSAVVAADTEEYAIRKEDIPKILEEYDILAKEMIRREKEGKGFNFFHL